MSHVPAEDWEQGSILPIVALLFIVLLGFAAFTVDLGAAWAERRQDQTAADAAAMAAGLAYLSEAAPSSADTINTVMDYAARNLPDPPTEAEWQSCVDNDKPDEFYIPLDDGGDPNDASAPANTYDCISMRQVSGSPTLIRVRIPNRDVPTAFARVIGIDSIAITAAAIAELQYQDLADVLPFSLPAVPNPEECLGVPPNGHNDGDVAPCSDGSDSGNFGLIDSPWFGDEEGETCFDGDYELRTERNIAVGLDHVVQIWPHDDLPTTDDDLKGYPEGLDNCDSALTSDPPYILLTQTGTESGNREAFSDGMIGDGPYYLDDPTADPPNVPELGRLRQDGGLNVDLSDRLLFDDPNREGYLDNVGLWEYLVPGGYGDDCVFPDDMVGRARTEQMLKCADGTDDGDDIPVFDLDLTESPRFAIVPVLSYTAGLISGSSGYGILELRPVYIQATWYACTNYGTICLFHPDDFVNEGMNPVEDHGWDSSVPMWYSPVFNPGEGMTPPCQSKKGYDPSDYAKKPDDFQCIDPTKIMLLGSSGIVLEWDDIPGAANALGITGAPYRVRLYR